MPSKESDGFLGPKVIKSSSSSSSSSRGCCRSKHTWNCCVATGVFGALFVIVGIVVLLLGKGLLEAKILKSMALIQGSDRFESWLHPPVQPHLYGYTFHVRNPEAVLAGKKPILEERGPYVYKSVTVKDSDYNIKWHDDGTMTYRERKIYTFEPRLSGPGLDPYKDYVTVPNIPLWTGLHGQRSKSGIAKGMARSLILENGRATPFVNVTFDGLLWGYEDELPCLRLNRPSQCGKGDEPFSEDDDEEFDIFERKKREAQPTPPPQTEKEDPKSEYYGLARPKAEFVNCSCQWGLFRDRNITLRQSTRFYTGEKDISLKGIVTEYDGSKELNWWKKGSQCDAVKGQDSSTLPPGVTKEQQLEIYISIMCRTIKLEFEKEIEHAGIRSLRFIPPPNAMGAHDDPDDAKRNPDNECYCLKQEQFKCFKSGVMNMEPCKRDTQAPLALSMPHFYQADESYLNAFIGLKPEKEKHQFFMDVVPEFGFPLAIRPRFQLNVVIGSGVDDGWEAISGMQRELVFPFLWAQDGFEEPSQEMAEAIKFGLAAPEKLPLLGAVVCFVVGGLMLLACLSYCLWHRKSARSQ